MEFAVLGPLRVRDGDRDMAPAGELQRVLLGVLLARANTVVPAETLADAMWGERPGERTGANLHLHVHRLLMIALYRGGQQGRAPAAYRAARQTLADELGQEPG